MHHVPFEKLEVWQKAMSIAEEIYAATKDLPPAELYGLIAQLKRAAVSVPSNIAEGRQRESGKDFIHFLRIASGSLAEIGTQLMLAKRLGCIKEPTAAHLRCKCAALRSMIHVFTKKMQI